MSNKRTDLNTKTGRLSVYSTTSTLIPSAIYSYLKKENYNTNYRWNWFLVYLLFPSEDVLVEEILDLLVGNVDAKLLEGVAASGTQMIFEAKNIQQANG